MRPRAGAGVANDTVVKNLRSLNCDRCSARLLQPTGKNPRSDALGRMPRTRDPSLEECSAVPKAMTENSIYFRSGNDEAINIALARFKLPEQLECLRWFPIVT